MTRSSFSFSANWSKWEEEKHVEKAEEGQAGSSFQCNDLCKCFLQQRLCAFVSGWDGKRVARRPLLFLVFSIKLLISLQLCLCQSLEIFYVNDQHWSSWQLNCIFLYPNTQCLSSSCSGQRLPDTFCIVNRYEYTAGTGHQILYSCLIDSLTIFLNWKFKI